jgi:transposase
LAAAGKTAVIPPKANLRNPREYDRDLYKARHLVENFFAKLKQFAPSPLDTTRPPVTFSPPFA